jgi:putative nucleotidyltransferase with HDIG domain
MGDRLTVTPNIEDVTINDHDLPPMPNVAQQILKLISDPDTTAEVLQKKISSDQALTTRILKVANSPFYGVPRSVRTLSTAIMILGYKMIRNLVLTTMTKSINRKFGLIEMMMWEHSIGVSVASFLIAKEVRFPDPEEAFLAGLLHDIGKQVLNNCEAEKYMRVIERTYNEGISYYFAEKEIFGFTHTEIGALVIKKWKLSEELENAIRYHHDGFQTLFESNPVNMGKLPVIVNLADLICLKLGIGRKYPIPDLNITDSDSAALLKLTEDNIYNLIDNVRKNIEAEKEAFGY